MTDTSRWTSVLDFLPIELRENVSRETFEQIDRFAALLVEENQRQNLIASASEPLPARERALARRSSGISAVVSIRSATSCAIGFVETPAPGGYSGRRRGVS